MQVETPEDHVRCRPRTGIRGHNVQRLIYYTILYYTILLLLISTLGLVLKGVMTHCVLCRTVLARAGFVSIDAVTSEVSRERYQIAEASDTDTSLLLVTW